MVSVLILSIALGSTQQVKQHFRPSFYLKPPAAARRARRQFSKAVRVVGKHWSYGEDFDPRYLQNGVWKYGFYDPNTFNFRNDGFYWLDYLGKGLQASANSADQPQFGVQHVKNPRGNAVYFDGNLYWPPGATSLHPGRMGEAAVVRFIAPHSGSYTFHYNFYPMDVNVTTRAFYVFKGVIVDGRHGIRHSVSYAGAWSNVGLLAGENVDFCLDDGLNTNASDTTGFSLEVDVS